MVSPNFNHLVLCPVSRKHQQPTNSEPQHGLRIRQGTPALPSDTTMKSRVVAATCADR